MGDRKPPPVQSSNQILEGKRYAIISTDTSDHQLHGEKEVHQHMQVQGESEKEPPAQLPVIRSWDFRNHHQHRHQRSDTVQGEKENHQHSYQSSDHGISETTTSTDTSDQIQYRGRKRTTSTVTSHQIMGFQKPPPAQTPAIRYRGRKRTTSTDTSNQMEGDQKPPPAQTPAIRSREE